MARLVITGMPRPEIEWCAVCVALAKGVLFADDATARRAQEGLADAGRDVVIIAPPPGLNLAAQMSESVTMAPSPVVGGGIPVPLCWTHAPLVDGSAPPPAQPPAGPGLITPKGRG